MAPSSTARERKVSPARSADREADRRFMGEALTEARRGLGRTAPNPAVGALVVKRGRILGRGFHAKAGGPHAEVLALRAAGAAARGATLYASLEPCNHQGKTPPCAEAILAAGIARVVVASNDPNPLVNGKGIRRLRSAGVEVVRGVEKAAADRLNRAWFHFITQGVPYVTLKVAMTADGRLATASGDSRWITGPASRLTVHRLRDEVDAVLVGAGTVLADDPALTVRLPGRTSGRQPLRVVLDGRLRVPTQAKVFRPGHLLLTSRALPTGDRRTAEVLPARRGHLSLLQVLRRLGRRGVAHLLVEGGAAVFSEFLTHGLWDELWLFVAPKLAGPQGISWYSAASVPRMAEALVLGRFRASSVDGDALLIVERPPPRRL